MTIIRSKLGYLAIITLVCAAGAPDSEARAEQRVEQPAEQSVQADASTEFLAVTDEFAKTLLQHSPMLATQLGVSEDYVGHKFSDKLDDYSVAAGQRAKALTDQFLERLRETDRDALTGTAATTYDVLETALTVAAKFQPYVTGSYGPLGTFSPYLVSQLSGPHIDVPRHLQTQHPLNSEQDIQDYLTRLAALQDVLSAAGQTVLHDAQDGVSPPKFALDGALSTIDQITAMPADQHPLVVSLKQRSADIQGLDAKARDEYLAQAAELVESKVYPGYRSLADALRSLHKDARTDAGVWALPNGEDRYALALENFGGAGKTAEQIHRIGLDEVARIQAEMDELLRAQGRTEGSVIERYIALSEDDEFLYSNDDQGRQELLDALNQQVDEITARLPEIIATQPKSGVEVRRIAVHEQDSAPGGYYTRPSLDGSRPGIYWINLKDTADWPSFTLPTLTYHEANPGHHLQVTIAQEIEDAPMINNILWFSQYGEGWALYAELLAAELGLYDDDPYGNIGRLQSELFRAARLVVDTGIHHKKWSREKAIDWMRANTGESLGAVTREIERYAVLPGQACSYKLGQLKILELRRSAEQRLGDAFDLARFNDQILLKGAVPLPVLEANVEAWINAQSN